MSGLSLSFIENASDSVHRLAPNSSPEASPIKANGQPTRAQILLGACNNELPTIIEDGIRRA
jgi:hypothetical protein